MTPLKVNDIIYSSQNPVTGPMLVTHIRARSNDEDDDSPYEIDVKIWPRDAINNPRSLWTTVSSEHVRYDKLFR